MERLAALEAEVKADADVQRARKAAVVAKLRDQRVTRTAQDRPGVRNRISSSHDAAERAEGAEAIDEPAARRRARGERGDADHLEDLGGALELASKANRVKQELQRTPGKGEKSWIKSGVASLALGPVGWLYAGSLREAAPAALAWIALLALASHIFLLLPVLMVFSPLSAIAGVVYALQYNRAGKRQRLFTGDKAGDKSKQLRSGRPAS